MIGGFKARVTLSDYQYALPVEVTRINAYIGIEFYVLRPFEFGPSGLTQSRGNDNLRGLQALPVSTVDLKRPTLAANPNHFRLKPGGQRVVAIVGVEVIQILVCGRKVLAAIATERSQ